MNKPTSLARMEFVNNLSNVINKAELPPYMIYDIMGNFMVDIKKIMDEQFETEMAEYNKQLAEESASEDKPEADERK